MVEESPASETSVTLAAPKGDETLAPNAQETQTSNETTTESNAQVGTESTCNNNNNNVAETSSGGDREKSLEFADQLMDRGSKAIKDNDLDEAAECFSRALEIRVAHYGELATECVHAYYKYGCALLYKAQDEADPLATLPKKEDDSQQDSAKDGSVKNAINRESSSASVSSNVEEEVSTNHQEGAADDGHIVSIGKDQGEEDDDSDGENLAEADEDESDLDLAWKMLDVARAIVEKHSNDSMEKVDILSALAEVALEREDIETSLSDYQKALSILERLVEQDSRQIAELNFRICLCLEVGSKPQEAIPYCQKAISVCKSRVQRLMNEVKSVSESTISSSASELDQGVNSNVSQSDNSATDKGAEIGTLTDLCGDLEKKLEDLQQLTLSPKSILAEILGMASVKSRGSASPVVMSSSQMGTANSKGGFDSPTISTAHTNGSTGVTHLGVVGRGVKRVNSVTAESSAMKKPASDSSENKGDGKTS